MTDTLFPPATDRVPPYIALVDKNEVILYQRDKLEPIYKNEILFDKGIPSSPDVEVVERERDCNYCKIETRC